MNHSCEPNCQFMYCLGATATTTNNNNDTYTSNNNHATSNNDNDDDDDDDDGTSSCTAWSDYSKVSYNNYGIV